MIGKKVNDYQYSCDKIYAKYGKIVTMIDDLRSCGCFDSSFSPPVHRMVVIGENNSGKTSVINYLTGYNFLPFGTHTNRTLEIRFQHTSENISPMIKIEGESKNFTNMDEAKKYIQNLQNDANDDNLYEPIRLTLTTNSSDDMLIIDTQVIDNSKANTIGIMKRYVQDSSNLILLVLNANLFQEQNSSIRENWFKIIKENDRNLERTICVITKTDELPKNFNFNIIKNLLKENNDILNLKYGFICVKSNFASHYSINDISRLEREYFCNHKVFQFLSINDNFTFETLGEKITKYFYDTYQFKKDIIYMYNQMKERLAHCEKELQSFGADYLDFSAQSKDLYLQSLVNLFCETIEKTFSGKAEFEADNLANTALKKVYVDFLDNYINFRPSKHYKNDEIITQIQRSEGTGLNGFPTGDVIYTLLDPEIETLRNEIKAYFDNIFGMIQDMIKTIIGRLFKRFPKALTQIEELVLKFVEDEFNKTRNLQTDIAEMNFTYFYIDELSNDYQKLIQLSLLKDENNQNNTNNINQNQKNEMPFKKTSEISFFKSAKDNDSYYKGLADYVKSLDDYIYYSIIRNLREYIPKATGYFFVKSLKTNLRFYLLQYISKNQEFSQNLEEDQDMANKREYYSECVKKLKKISKNISYDDQLTKIIKGDNMKNINTILESQGIARNKSSENLEKLSSNNTTSNQNNTKTPIQSNPNTNLFSSQNQNKQNQNKQNPIPANNQNTIKNNIFGNPPVQNKQPSNQSKMTNLFGNPIQQNKPQPQNSNQKKINNLFGEPQSNKPQPQNSNKDKLNNVFGTNKNQEKKKEGVDINFKYDFQKGQVNDVKLGEGNKPKGEGLDVNVKYDFKTGQVQDVRVADGKIGLSDVKKAYDTINPYLPDKETMMKIGKGALNMGQKIYNAIENQNKNASPNKKGGDPLSNLFGMKKK